MPARLPVEFDLDSFRRACGAGEFISPQSRRIAFDNEDARSELVGRGAQSPFPVAGSQQSLPQFVLRNLLPDAHAAWRGVNAGAMPRRPLIEALVNYRRVVGVCFMQFKSPNGRDRNEGRRNDGQNATLIGMNVTKLRREVNRAQRAAQVSDFFIRKPSSSPSSSPSPVAHAPSIPTARRSSRQV